MRLQRGFTMLEFMVASGIAGLVTIGVLELLRGQVAGYDRQARVQDAQANVRTAMDMVLEKVAPAGFGIAPEYMIGPNTANNRPSVGPAPESICEGTDVLEIRSRNPLGFWRMTGATNATISMRQPLTGEFSGATPVSYTIPKGTYLFAFVSASQYALVRATADPLTPSTTTSAFGIVNDAESTKLASYSATNGEVMATTTSRFFVSCTRPTHPVLMLDIAKLGEDPSVVAEEIEDFQVAYLLDSDQDGSLSSAEANAAVHVLTAAQHPMIKAIRVSLVGRSALPLYQGQASVTVSAPPTLEDHVPSGAADRLSRRILQQTILLENRDTAKGALYQHFSNRYL